MLAASPPSVTMPWTWSPGGSCWRSRPRATWAMAMASPALIPCHGAAEAWALLPVKVDVEVGHGQAGAGQPVAAARGGPSWPRGRRRRRPASSMMILPPPPSSAGVPRTRTVRPSSSARGASPSPAPTAEAAMMLWPQAWPTSGQGVVLGADGHHQRARAGLGAEGGGHAGHPRGHGRSPPVAGPPRSRREAWSSSKEVSGWSWMAWLSATRSGQAVVDGPAGRPSFSSDDPDPVSADRCPIGRSGITGVEPATR